MQIARWLTLMVLLFGITCSPAVAQSPWSIFVAGGAAGFGGASRATDDLSEITQYKPGATTRFHLGAVRSFGRVAVALDASYAKAALNADGDGAWVGLNPAFTLYDLRLLVNYEIARIGTEATLQVGLGPMLQIWSGRAVNSTLARIGAAAAITLVAPISRRFALFTSGSVGVAGSPFDQASLDEVGLFVQTNTWTRELLVGLRYGL